MASSTLVTFFLYVLQDFLGHESADISCGSLLPRNAKRVELFGSWDNFRKPYPMRRDKDVGPRNWRGCFSFSGIVCDGEDLLGAVTKRDGALLMGGKYWYYYRLDDDAEYCNPHQPSTTACPLLPGQYVNVLEMPVEMVAHGPSSPAALQPELESAFTLNPDDKFNTKPRAPKDPDVPKAPVPACQSRRSQPSKAGASQTKESKAGVSGLTQDLIRLKTHGFDGSYGDDDDHEDANRRRSLPPSRRESLRSAIRHLRRNRSVHVPRKGWDKAEPSVTGLPVNGPSAGLDGVPPYYTSATSDKAELADSGLLQEVEARYCKPVSKPLETFMVPSDILKSDSSPAAVANGLTASDRATPPCQTTCSQAPAPQPPLGVSNVKKSLTIRTRPEEKSWTHLGQYTMSPADATLDADLSKGSAPSEPENGSAVAPGRQAHKHLSLASSNRTSGVFSLDSQAEPCTEPSSPALMRDSQPITPTLLDGSFDAAPLVYARPTAYGAHNASRLGAPDPASAWLRQQQDAWQAEDAAAGRAFLGYSLPAEQYASEQTLRPPHSEGKARAATPGVVQSADGNGGRSALDELVEDMGYLGALIV